MKIKILLVCLCIAVLVIYTVYSSNVGPKIVLTDDENLNAKALNLRLNLGVIENIYEIIKEIPVINQSSKTITLKPHRTSCGCTTLEIPDEQIAPGESKNILVHLDPFTKKGALRQEVAFAVANNNLELVNIILNASVDSKLTVETRTLVIDEDDIDKKHRIIVNHNNNLDYELKLNNNDYIQSITTIKNESEQIFELKFDPNLLMKNSHTLNFLLNNKKEIDISILVNTKKPIVVKPSYLMLFKPLESNELVTFRNEIISNCDCNSLKILSDIEGIEFEILETEKEGCTLIAYITDYSKVYSDKIEVKCQQNKIIIPLLKN